MSQASAATRRCLAVGIAQRDEALIEVGLDVSSITPVDFVRIRRFPASPPLPRCSNLFGMCGECAASAAMTECQGGDAKASNAYSYQGFFHS